MGTFTFRSNEGGSDRVIDDGRCGCRGRTAADLEAGLGPTRTKPRSPTPLQTGPAR